MKKTLIYGGQASSFDNYCAQDDSFDNYCAQDDKYFISYRMTASCHSEERRDEES